MGDIMGEFIDFADIYNQIYRQEMNRLYEFNLMLVGSKASGKSDLVTSLFEGAIKPHEVQDSKLNEYEQLLEEDGVRLKVRCIETSKFNLYSGESKVEQEAINYLDNQLKAYFVDEVRKPLHIKDRRVHCCLYLIPPHGDLKLEDNDIRIMRALHRKVNLVPIVTKTELFSPEDLEKFKENILTSLIENDIKFFKFHFDEKEDEDRAKSVRNEVQRFPFAIVTASHPTHLENTNGRVKWVRKTINAENDIMDPIWDFGALSKLLLRHCMLDLIDTTHIDHYARYKGHLLDQAKETGGLNLDKMGFKEHERDFIMFFIKPDQEAKPGRYSELLKENEELKLKLEMLKLDRTHGDQSPLKKDSKPATPRKPSFVNF